MKNKSIVLATVLALVFSLCFSMVAYGGDTPIIPLPGDNDSTTTTTTESNTGGWETPTVIIDVPVSITKCTFSTITSKVYTGNALTPAPTVKYKGKTLKKGTDYTLKYASNKYVGTASVTVTGKGNYTGSKKLTFKIKPRTTTVTKATSPKKHNLKVTWKKRTTQTTGYQIQCATDSKFTKNVKKLTATSTKTTTKIFTKLKSGKKYYVRVRTYKTVKGTKYYSSWTKYSKTVKIK